MRLRTETIMAALGHSQKARGLNWNQANVKDDLVGILMKELHGWISEDEAREYADRLIATHDRGHLVVA